MSRISTIIWHSSEVKLSFHRRHSALDKRNFSTRSTRSRQIKFLWTGSTRLSEYLQKFDITLLYELPSYRIYLRKCKNVRVEKEGTKLFPIHCYLQLLSDIHLEELFFTRGVPRSIKVQRHLKMDVNLQTREPRVQNFCRIFASILICFSRVVTRISFLTRLSDLCV